MDKMNGLLMLVMGLSLVLQFWAAALAIRMIKPSGVYVAWVFLACGFIIQGIRRVFSLVYALDGHFQGDMTVEVLGLVISLLMFCGIFKFRHLFDKINTSRQSMLKIQSEMTAANHELKDFVGMASHDLRIPLTVINGYVELLKDGYSKGMDVKALKYLERIDSEGSRMARLLEDLLTLATVGYVERPERPVDVSSVVDEVLVELDGLLIATGGTVLKRDLPAVHVPKTFLAEMFKNLIANALRYACKEGAQIEVGGETVGGKLRYYVCDHGQGIPEDERDRIFDMFYRGTSGRAIGGTGIGLAIVQKVAQLYGGKVWVKETPGGGSTFWIEVEDHSSV